MSEYAVEVRGLTKKFRRYRQVQQYGTFKGMLVQWGRSLLGRTTQSGDADKFAVLENIDLLVPKGRSIGLIGRNGCGKSTLLRLMAGIYWPDAGTVRVHGRVASLLELGAGFHPEFSGRENVFIYGIILGLTRKEIRAKFDEIVAFAELEEFIDAPVRTYSSGMFMRLAFSVATHLDPDVFLIDEALAVGDASFSLKCGERLRRFREQGKSLVIVSHVYPALLKLVDKIHILHEGVLSEAMEPEEAVATFTEQILPAPAPAEEDIPC